MAGIIVFSWRRGLFSFFNAGRAATKRLAAIIPCAEKHGGIVRAFRNTRDFGVEPKFSMTALIRLSCRAVMPARHTHPRPPASEGMLLRLELDHSHEGWMKNDRVPRASRHSNVVRIPSLRRRDAPLAKTSSLPHRVAMWVIPRLTTRPMATWPQGPIAPRLRGNGFAGVWKPWVIVQVATFASTVISHQITLLATRWGNDDVEEAGRGCRARLPALGVPMRDALGV